MVTQTGIRPAPTAPSDEGVRVGRRSEFVGCRVGSVVGRHVDGRTNGLVLDVVVEWHQRLVELSEQPGDPVGNGASECAGDECHRGIVRTQKHNGCVEEFTEALSMTGHVPATGSVHSDRLERCVGRFDRAHDV